MTNILSLTIHLNLSREVDIRYENGGLHHWVVVDGINIFCKDAESAEGLEAALRTATLNPALALPEVQ